MGINLYFRDERLNGMTPPSVRGKFHSWTVRNWSLRQFVNQCLIQRNHFGQISQLFIAAHGRENLAGNGGYGASFCREGITWQTAGQLKDLKDKVDHIIFLVCGFANQAPSLDRKLNPTPPNTPPQSIVHFGDGRRLCREIAKMTNARVTAATKRQLFETYEIAFPLPWGSFDTGDFVSPIEFGRWEGPVITFDGSGNEIPFNANELTQGL